MSDANEAWEKWYGNPDVASDNPSIAFAAGFAAGQVSALEDAADALERRGQPTALASPDVWAFLRARAAELSKAQDA